MEHESSTNPFAVAAAVVVIVAAAGLGWYLMDRRPEGPAATQQALPDPAGEENAEPEFPLPPSMPDRSRPENLTPLPDLDDSDRYFEMELGDVLGPGLIDLLVDESLIRNFVATVDNLPRRTVAERIRPVGRLDESFRVEAADDDDEYVIDEASFERYTPLVAMLDSADPDALVDVYRRYYPLFQEAYVNLGYPDGYFNDRLVEVIDHLLETPVEDRPLRLVRPHVLYEYADPDLEALSAGQKILLRSGPENATELKRLLRELRERITSGDSP